MKRFCMWLFFIIVPAGFLHISVLSKTNLSKLSLRSVYPVFLQLDSQPTVFGAPWKYNRNPFSRPPNSDYDLLLKWESSNSDPPEEIEIKIASDYEFTNCAISTVITPMPTPTPPGNQEYKGSFKISESEWQQHFQDKTRYYYTIRFKINGNWEPWTTEIYNEDVGESTPHPFRADWFYIDSGFTGFSYENTNCGRSYDTMNHHPIGETDSGHIVRDHEGTLWTTVEYPTNPLPCYPSETPPPNLFQSNIGLLRGIENQEGTIEWDLPPGAERPYAPTPNSTMRPILVVSTPQPTTDSFRENRNNSKEFSENDKSDPLYWRNLCPAISLSKLSEWGCPTPNDSTDVSYLHIIWTEGSFYSPDSAVGIFPPDVIRYALLEIKDNEQYQWLENGTCINPTPTGCSECSSYGPYQNPHIASGFNEECEPIAYCSWYTTNLFNGQNVIGFNTNYNDPDWIEDLRNIPPSLTPTPIYTQHISVFPGGQINDIDVLRGSGNVFIVAGSPQSSSGIVHGKPVNGRYEFSTPAPVWSTNVDPPDTTPVPIYTQGAVPPSQTNQFFSGVNHISTSPLGNGQWNIYLGTEAQYTLSSNFGEWRQMGKTIVMFRKLLYSEASPTPTFTWEDEEIAYFSPLDTLNVDSAGTPVYTEYWLQNDASQCSYKNWGSWWDVVDNGTMAVMNPGTTDERLLFLFENMDVLQYQAFQKEADIYYLSGFYKNNQWEYEWSELRNQSCPTPSTTKNNQIGCFMPNVSMNQNLSSGQVDLIWLASDSYWSYFNYFDENVKSANPAPPYPTLIPGTATPVGSPTWTPTPTGTPTPINNNYFSNQNYRSYHALIYECLDLSTPTATPTPTNTTACINSGDVNQNSAITSSDSQLAYLIVLELYSPTYVEECAADCNGDDIVTAGDAQAIMQVALGQLSSCADPL